MATIVDQLITRAKLSATHRIRKAYAGPVAGAYAHALAGEVENPGRNAGVITDGMILSRVQTLA